MKLLITTQKVDKNDPILGFFHRWVEEFAKHLEGVIVICLEEGDHEFPSNVKVFSLGKEESYSRVKHLFRFYKYTWQERKNYDAVFVHMNQIYAILGSWFWHIWGKRVALWYAHRSIPMSLRMAEKLVDIVFSTTPKSFRLGSEKLLLTGHGIDLSQFEKTESDNNEKFTIISVGRISPVKDYEIILDVSEGFKKSGEDIRTVIVGGAGTNEQEGYFTEIKQSAEIRDLNIIFTGPLPHTQIPEHLSRADLFIHTSKTGSLDKVALEAMALELPLVSSNDSVKEIFPPHLKEMLAFEEGDANDMSNKIKGIYNKDRKERQAIGKELRAIVARDHDLTSLIKRLLNELNESNRKK